MIFTDEPCTPWVPMANLTNVTSSNPITSSASFACTPSPTASYGVTAASTSTVNPLPSAVREESDPLIDKLFPKCRPKQTNPSLVSSTSSYLVTQELGVPQPSLVKSISSPSHPIHKLASSLPHHTSIKSASSSSSSASSSSASACSGSGISRSRHPSSYINYSQNKSGHHHSIRIGEPRSIGDTTPYSIESTPPHTQHSVPLTSSTQDLDLDIVDSGLVNFNDNELKILNNNQVATREDFSHNNLYLLSFSPVKMSHSSSVSPSFQSNNKSLPNPPLSHPSASNITTSRSGYKHHINDNLNHRNQLQSETVRGVGSMRPNERINNMGNGATDQVATYHSDRRNLRGHNNTDGPVIEVPFRTGRPRPSTESLPPTSLTQGFQMYRGSDFVSLPQTPMSHLQTSSTPLKSFPVSSAPSSTITTSPTSPSGPTQTVAMNAASTSSPSASNITSINTNMACTPSRLLGYGSHDYGIRCRLDDLLISPTEEGTSSSHPIHRDAYQTTRNGKNHPDAGEGAPSPLKPMEKQDADEDPSGSRIRTRRMYPDSGCGNERFWAEGSTHFLPLDLQRDPCSRTQHHNPRQEPPPPPHSHHVHQYPLYPSDPERRSGRRDSRDSGKRGDLMGERPPTHKGRSASQSVSSLSPPSSLTHGSINSSRRASAAASFTHKGAPTVATVCHSFHPSSDEESVEPFDESVLKERIKMMPQNHGHHSHSNHSKHPRSSHRRSLQHQQLPPVHSCPADETMDTDISTEPPSPARRDPPPQDLEDEVRNEIARVIGNIPIALYEGSPRRYGMKHGRMDQEGGRCPSSSSANSMGEKRDSLDLERTLSVDVNCDELVKSILNFPLPSAGLQSSNGNMESNVDKTTSSTICINTTSPPAISTNVASSECKSSPSSCGSSCASSSTSTMSGPKDGTQDVSPCKRPPDHSMDGHGMTDLMSLLPSHVPNFNDSPNFPDLNPSLEKGLKEKSLDSKMCGFINVASIRNNLSDSDSGILMAPNGIGGAPSHKSSNDGFSSSTSSGDKIPPIHMSRITPSDLTSVMDTSTSRPPVSSASSSVFSHENELILLHERVHQHLLQELGSTVSTQGSSTGRRDLKAAATSTAHLMSGGNSNGMSHHNMHHGHHHHHQHHHHHSSSNGIPSTAGASSSSGYPRDESGRYNKGNQEYGNHHHMGDGEVDLAPVDNDCGDKVDESRNFTLSPETTDCDSNEIESEYSLSSGSRVNQMPVLEDGLSSGIPSSDSDCDDYEYSNTHHQQHLMVGGKKPLLPLEDVRGTVLQPDDRMCHSLLAQSLKEALSSSGRPSNHNNNNNNNMLYSGTSSAAAAAASTVQLPSGTGSTSLKEVRSSSHSGTSNNTNCASSSSSSSATNTTNTTAYQLGHRLNSSVGSSTITADPLMVTPNGGLGGAASFPIQQQTQQQQQIMQQQQQQGTPLSMSNSSSASSQLQLQQQQQPPSGSSSSSTGQPQPQGSGHHLKQQPSQANQAGSMLENDGTYFDDNSRGRVEEWDTIDATKVRRSKSIQLQQQQQQQLHLANSSLLPSGNNHGSSNASASGDGERSNMDPHWRSVPNGDALQVQEEAEGSGRKPEKGTQDEECDTDQETDRLLGAQRSDEKGSFDEKNNTLSNKKKNTSREAPFHEPAVLIEGVLFRARYLGSTQLICEGQPTKATRMLQAEEAVSRIKVPEGEAQPNPEVDLFISTEKIMVLNTDLKEIMMDHSLRTISYIADIGDLLVLMARRRVVNAVEEKEIKRVPKMICHVFESEEAQFIAQSIGQAFQVAYMEFLKANGIEDSSFVKEMDYQEVLNSQEIFGDELEMFARKDKQKEVICPKQKGEILGMVIVESGWGSMLPTVVIANMAHSSPAARCGHLNIGDQIIAINGISLVGLPLSTCQNYIKNTKNQNAVKLTVVPCPPVVEVKIKRPDTKYQLGFSVQNGVICSLLRGGIAERGGVRVGHRIIEINGQSVVAVPHERIVNLLATSVGEITMKTMPTSMFRLLTGQESPVFM